MKQLYRALIELDDDATPKDYNNFEQPPLVLCVEAAGVSGQKLGQQLVQLVGKSLLVKSMDTIPDGCGGLTLRLFLQPSG